MKEEKYVVKESAEPLISMIVPIYNVELYLRDCLLSIRNQSYSHLEIILVNDGSSDSSRDICVEFCKKDVRFVLVEQENAGLSAARNKGLDVAHGAYLCFIDADDCIHEKYVEILYQSIVKHQMDMCMCTYYKGSDYQQYRQEIQIHDVTSWIKDRMELLKDLSTVGADNKAEKVVVSWNKLIKCEILQQLRFRVNKLHEDEFMINEYLKKIDKIVWVDEPLYFYRQRPESIMANGADLRHLHILEADIERVRTFSGKKYREVIPALVKAYFVNVRLFYQMLIRPDNKKQLAVKILPGYFKMMVCYSYLLNRNDFFQAVKFVMKINRWI